MNTTDKYQSPLLTRYASEEMLYVFSDDFKFSTWRHLWIALAKAEKKLGLPITQAQINELEKHKDDIDFEKASEFEKETRHDVMAHVKTYALQCPKAAKIIHWGATSAYVGDNTDLVQLRTATQLILVNLVSLIRDLTDFARKHSGVPTLGYTHFQPAQPTTVGKRVCLWIQDLLFDLKDLETFLTDLKFLGVKGTTGTQASFLNLFEGNEKKVYELDKIVTKSMGFKETFPVTGQTYPRKVDSKILSILTSVAQSCHKFANDLRLLQHIKEMEEPFGNKQIGSSAMAYKRNPMRSERICSLARYIMSVGTSTGFTAATQWFERTLDDSANKRIAIPESFLALDSILTIYRNIAQGMVVNKKIIAQRLNEETPYMATENILMEATKRGGNRQTLHEVIRELSHKNRKAVIEGGKCNLLEDIINNKEFKLSSKEIYDIANPKHFIGLAQEQTKSFIKNTVTPVLRRYPKIKRDVTSLKV